MDQEIAATLRTEQFLAAPGLDGSPGAADPFSKKQKSWIPPVEQMPPIAQCAVRLVQWCQSKRRTGRKEGATLRLVGQLALGAKRHLALVEVGGMQFLVGGGAEHVTVIVPVPAGTPAPAANVRGAAESGGAGAGIDAAGELLP